MVRAQQVIPAVLAEIVRKAPLCPEKVAFAWRTAVGPAVDRVTRVRLGEHGVLQVTAVDAHWAREVKRSSKLILSRVQMLLGADTVARLDVARGDRPERRRRPPLTTDSD